MTVSNTSVLQVYTCNGVTTTFAIPFQWFDLTQIKVYKLLIATGELTQLVVNTDYIYNDPTTPTTVQTVDGVGDPLALSSAYKVIVSRSTPRTQVVDYINNGEFKAEDHERGMDRIVMELQEAADEADRSIKLSPVDGLDLTLPPIQASSVIAVNSTGDGLEYKDQADFVGATGPGVPTGGTSGQLLEKASGSDYDAEWVDPPESLPLGGTTGQILTKASDDDGDADWEDPVAPLPLTTKGDLLVTKASSVDRLPIGANGQVLTADSTQLSGVKWTTPPTIPSAIDYPNSAPQDVDPASGIGLGNYAEQIIFIQSANVDADTEQPITADPPLASVKPAGWKVRLVGASLDATKILSIDSGTHLFLKGPFIFNPGSVLDLFSDGDDWYESQRSSL